MKVSINNSIIHVQGEILHSFNKATLIASAPIDTMQNYSGSGLPFPNSEIAFHNTPNKIDITSSFYQAQFIYPNSFYDFDTLIPPTIYLMIDGKTVEKYELPNPLPLRTLTHRSMRSQKREHFYGSKDFMLPIDTAENVMRTYASYKVLHNIA
tara:strand:+ start:11155 stop:11613 length:459 start_codon:yes stop_codon:yes gene_type:complete